MVEVKKYIWLNSTMNIRIDQMQNKNLTRSIFQRQPDKVESLLASNPSLAFEIYPEDILYEQIPHWMYKGDTLLHLAAALHHYDIVSILLASGLDPTAAGKRGGNSLHYAADGHPPAKSWNGHDQVETIKILLAAGAPIDGQDKNGATPLHRATRTRCADATETFISMGCDPELKNNSGSTAFHLAVQTTGRGQSGSDASRFAQEEIVKSFLRHLVPIDLTDGKGRTVFQAASRPEIKALFEQSNG